MYRPFPRRQVLAALVAVPAVALLAACSDSDEAKAQDRQGGRVAAPTPATPAAAEAPKPAGSVDMAKLLEPGALPEKSLGKDDAKVTIVEYASMTCPHCAHFHATTLPELKTKYIDTGKVRLILREFPFDPRAEAGFMLARCAGDNYFPMVDVLFKQQMQWAGVENAKDALLQICQARRFYTREVRGLLDGPETSGGCQGSARARRRRSSASTRRRPSSSMASRYPGAMSIEEMSAIIDPLL